MASGNIGLTRKEAKQDAEQVVHSLWPGAWKKNEHNLHCIQRKPHNSICCPPVTIYKRLGRTEIETLFSLVLTNIRIAKSGGASISILTRPQYEDSISESNVATQAPIQLLGSQLDATAALSLPRRSAAGRPQPSGPPRSGRSRAVPQVEREHALIHVAEQVERLDADVGAVKAALSRLQKFSIPFVWTRPWT